MALSCRQRRKGLNRDEACWLPGTQWLLGTDKTEVPKFLKTEDMQSNLEAWKLQKRRSLALGGQGQPLINFVF